MKKIFVRVLCALLLAVLALTAVSCNKDDGVPDGMQNVAVANVPFDLYVPEGWISQTSSGISGARVSNQDNSNVTVTIYMPDEVMDAETYWNDRCLPEYQASEGHAGLPEFTLIADQCGDAALGGVNAKKYVFTFKMNNIKYQVMQIIAVEDSMVYTLQYHATADNYANHTETVESIRQEFRFH